MAEAYPEEGWLQPDPGDVIQYEPRQWHGLYFRAFDALRYDRPYGALGGQMPIYYTAYSAYAKDHSIIGQAFGEFLRAMHQIDGVFLEEDAKARKAASEDERPA